MSSSKDYEAEIVDLLLESNFTNITSQKLDVVLTANPEHIIESTADEYLNRKYSFHGKPVSDHLPIKTTIHTTYMTFIKNRKKTKYA